jgi:hypothetical protein
VYVSPHAAADADPDADVYVSPHAAADADPDMYVPYTHATATESAATSA